MRLKVVQLFDVVLQPLSRNQRIKRGKHDDLLLGVIHKAACEANHSSDLRLTGVHLLIFQLSKLALHIIDKRQEQTSSILLFHCSMQTCRGNHTRLHRSSVIPTYLDKTLSDFSYFKTTRLAM